MFITLALTSQLVHLLKILKTLLRVTLKEELKISTDLRMLNKRQFALLMILTCQEKTHLVLNHLLSWSDNGLIMVSGMIDRKYSRTKYAISKFYLPWANQVEVEQKFQRDCNQSSILLTIQFQLRPKWRGSLKLSLLLNSWTLMKISNSYLSLLQSLQFICSTSFRRISYQPLLNLITCLTWEIFQRSSKVSIWQTRHSMKTKSK